jgi:hypothetical protein
VTVNIRLSKPQIAALGVLVIAKAGGQLCETGRESHAVPWFAINGSVARRLEAMRLVMSVCAMPNDRIISGADLVHLLGHWKTKYKITRLGERLYARGVGR